MSIKNNFKAGEMSWAEIVFKWMVWVMIFIPCCTALWDFGLAADLNLPVESPMMELHKEPRRARNMSDLGLGRQNEIYNPARWPAVLGYIL